MPKTPKDRLASKKANLQRVHIAMDPEVAEAYGEAKNAFDVAKLIAEARPDDPKLSMALEAEKLRLAEAKAALREDAVTFTFRGIGRKSYDDLVAEHPPTDEQRQKSVELTGDPRNIGFNTDTFPPVVIFRSMIEPEMTQEEVNALYDDPAWNGPEVMELFAAALAVNSTRRVVELGKDF